MQMKFVECDTCNAKPGSPVLCSGCLQNRSNIEKINNKIKDIRGRLIKDFPELAYCGGAYTIKMLDDDLKEVLG